MTSTHSISDVVSHIIGNENALLARSATLAHVGVNLAESQPGTLPTLYDSRFNHSYQIDSTSRQIHRTSGQSGLFYDTDKAAGNVVSFDGDVTEIVCYCVNKNWSVFEQVKVPNARAPPAVSITDVTEQYR